MISLDQARQIMGGTAITSEGDKLGKIGQVYLDDETGQPEWATVSTGLFGTRESFVPLAQAQISGTELSLPYTRDKVKGAPSVEAEGGHLSQQEEAELYTYYGLDYSEAPSESGLPVGVADRGTGYDAARTTATTPAATDGAMTRSEERLKVATVRQEVGRARLRKYIVTEQQTVTVPVSREEVQIVREPITAADIGDATSGPTLSEAEHEIVLHAERAVVDKEVVPVERVRLDTQTVTTQETVTEEVRKERIETQGVVGIDTPGGTGTGTGR